MDSLGIHKASYLKSLGPGALGARRLLSSASVFAMALSAGLALPDAARAADWTGATSTDWFTAGNWSTSAVPTAADVVTIDTVTPNPTVVNAANAAALYLYLGSGSLTTGALTISNGGTVSSTIGEIGKAATATGTVMITGAGSAWTVGQDIRVGSYGAGTLTISNGGAVSSYFGYLGVQAGSHGIGSVDGAGSTWTNVGDFNVGLAGTAALTISNGATVSNAAGWVGYLAGSIGTVTVDGVGSTWANNGGLTVGRAGDGTLNILNAGTVNSVIGIVGDLTGSTGTTLVDGAGTTWGIGGALVVGKGGQGKLAIANGGAVSNDTGYVGYDAGSAGSVTVTGAGSSWTTSSDVTVGYSGTGTLSIQGGGTVSAGSNGYIGNFAGSTGTATVDGAGSTWTNGGGLAVGYGGIGTLTVSNGGAVNNGGNLVVGTLGTGTVTISSGGAVKNDTGYLGFLTGSAGTMTVTGAGSTWNNNTDVVVGHSGAGTLNIQGGGTVSAGSNGYIGNLAGSTGTATVDGAGSTWTNAGGLGVGVQGAGTLTVSNGGAVSNGGTLAVGIQAIGTVTITSGGMVGNDTGYVGFAAGGAGTVTVTGAGSSWSNAGNLYVGYDGAGDVKITNGGVVTSNIGYLAYGTGSAGTVTIDGAGSAWNTLTGIAVGTSSVGTLSITNGGKASGDAGIIGAIAGATGTVTIDGAGSLWTATQRLFVGAGGNGSMTISGGGGAISDEGDIGFSAGSSGVATVTGAGSFWTNSGALFVGRDGAGTLNIRSGGAVTSSSGYVGDAAGSNGTATVDGAGSTWTSSGSLSVGIDGTGSLIVSNGGKVSNTTGFLGVKQGSIGSATVDGAGSTWTSSGSLAVGLDGSGTLTVSNGGTVNNDVGFLGVNQGSNGKATVDGAGSAWANTGSLGIGFDGSATLIVSNGGKVSSTTGYLGVNLGSIGSATVDGAGSTWANSSGLFVGAGGTGTLTIANGGTVSTGGVAMIALQPGSVGTLNIGGASGSAATGAGTLSATSVVFGSGTGTINFNHTDTNYIFAPGISGAGTINQIAGNTNLTADSSGFTGATYVTRGRLAVNGSIANSAVTVSGSGILGGNGTAGSVVANAGGIIGPGNSIGTLTINGNLTQAAGSTYQVELTSTGQSDRINATGAATIGNGALLDMIKLDAAPYVIGTHYTVLQANGGVSGTYTLTGNTKLSAFIGLVDSYDPTHVYLDVAQTKSFTSAGLTPNQIATGGGAESLGIGDPVYTAVAWLPTDAAAQYAFDQLSGEIHPSARTALIEDSRFVRNAVNDRLRAAFGTIGASEAAVATYDGQRGMAPATTDRLAVWGQGFGSWGHTDSDGNAARLNRKTGGFFIGADTPVFETWRFGAVAGYSRTDFDLKDRRSSGASDNYHVGFYGGTTWGDLAFRTAAAYTWHDISTSRNVIFPGFGDSLKGNYNAATAQVFGELGYGITAGAARFEPFANLAYVSVHTDGFTEQGGAAALSSQRATSDATFTTLGLRASTAFTMGDVNTTARGMLGWRHAFGDVTPFSTMRFAGGGNAFSIGGVPIARNAAVIEAGLDFALTPAATLGVTYGGQFGSGMSDQSVKANFNVKF
jgi:fibronectin-binding autotransporter adhesin